MSTPSFRLIRASAGTGKTYSLVETYVREIQRGLTPSEIVVITFTRKAAFELTSRIRARLVELGASEQILDELGRAPINNFHGLALQMLTALGPPFGLWPGTQILGEEGDDAILFTGVCLAAWLGDPALADDVVAVAEVLEIESVLPEALWQVLSKAREDGAEIDGKKLVGTYDVVALEQQFLTQLSTLARTLRDGYASQSPTTKEKIDAFLRAMPQGVDADRQAWVAKVELALEQLDRRGGLAKLIDKDEWEFWKKDFAEMLLAEERCGLLAPHLARLIDAAWQRYEREKQRGRLADFGDLVEKVVTALDSSPERHTQLTERFRSVLVDEAQDTNRLQHRFVRLLARIDGPAQSPAPNALHVVGDKKQAIYTFRGADPDSFDAFARDIASLEGEEETLSTSWRSTPEIVRGVNELGARLFEDYEALVPRAAANLVGRSQVTWLRVDTELDRVQTVRAEAQSVARFVRERVLRGELPKDFTVLVSAMTHAPTYAEALLQAGVPAVLGGGGGFYEQPEIVDVTNLLAWLCEPLRRLSAAIVLRSPIVSLTDNALLTLLWPRDAGGHLQALVRGEAPTAELSVESDRRALARLSAVLPKLVRAARVMSARDLLRYCDELLDLTAMYLALPGGEQRVANLERYVQMAEQRAARGGPMLFVREQLSRIAGRHREPVSPVTTGSAGAVTITTVHQSKGLEFPVVLLCDIGNKARGETGPLFYSREHGVLTKAKDGGDSLTPQRMQAALKAHRASTDDEKKRLLYVAVTRAIRELVIVDAAPERANTGFAQYTRDLCERGVEAGFVFRESAPEPTDNTLTAGDDVDTTAWLRETDSLVTPSSTVFTLPVTALATYAQCLRRGVLLHEVGLSEDNIAARLRKDALANNEDGLDPLARGRLAHAVLSGIERLGEHADAKAFVASEMAALGYDAHDPRLGDVVEDVLAFLDTELGRTLTRLDARQRRHELPFQFMLDAAPYQVRVHGQMDLVYMDDEGPVVVDFKHAKSSGAGLAAYETQLHAYAQAVALLWNVPGTVRTRLVFLKDPSRPPLVRDVTPEMREAFVAKTRDVVRGLAQVPGGANATWPGERKERCQSLDCGFVSRCHAKQSERQLTLV